MNLDNIVALFPKSVIGKQIIFFDDAFDYAAIDTKERAAMFIAQIGHESGGFTRMRENMNYDAAGLARTWPSRYAIDPKATIKKPNWIATAIARQPEVIGNLTYAGRMGNGNVASGEGWFYRGAGDMMTTGKAQFELLDDEFRLNGQLLENPDLLTDPYYSIMSAASFWKRNKLNAYADARDIRGARKVINGGTIGIDKVIPLYNDIIKAL